MVNSCLLIGGCRDWFLMCTPYRTLDRRRFGMRMVGMLCPLSSSCGFPLRLYASLPQTHNWLFSLMSASCLGLRPLCSQGFASVGELLCYLMFNSQSALQMSYQGKHNPLHDKLNLWFTVMTLTNFCLRRLWKKWSLRNQEGRNWAGIIGCRERIQSYILTFGFYGDDLW